MVPLKSLQSQQNQILQYAIQHAHQTTVPHLTVIGNVEQSGLDNAEQL